MEKTALKVDRIYRLKNDLEGLKICVLKSNRNNPVKNKKMLEGLLHTEMQQPGIFADAKLAMDAGYTLIDVEDGHTVTPEEVDDYLAITDGNTRFHAWKLGIEQKKFFEYIFQLKEYADSEAFRIAYQQMNVYNTPTSAADFARDILATSPCSVLTSYRARQVDGLTPKAAGFSVIGREIVKKDITEVQKGNMPSLFNDEPNRQRYERIYTGISPLVKGNLSMFKGTEIWSWNASKVNGANDKDKMVDRIIKMFMEMPAPTFVLLLTAKKEANKTKETVVKDILDAALSKVETDENVVKEVAKQ